MKTIITILSSVVFAALIGCGSADAKTEISVSSMQCGMCQKNIENGLGSMKGVKSVHVSMEDKVAHVTHDPKVIDLAGLEKEISKLGYQANETLADPLAYEALPGCCKVGGM
jgi:copper chaperone CopZ